MLVTGDKKSDAAGKKSEREARLAKALRENLKRRKAAARLAEQPNSNRDGDRNRNDDS